jgi:hypothetical protein
MLAAQLSPTVDDRGGLPRSRGQFTSFARTDQLKRVATRISMDGKGLCLDKIFTERPLRPMKHNSTAYTLVRPARRPTLT